MMKQFPVGQAMTVSYPQFTANVTIHSLTQMSFVIPEGPFAHSENVDIEVVSLGNSIFLVSWVEESGANVVNIQDYDRNTVHSYVTLPEGKFLRLVGLLEVTKPTDQPYDARPERNKALVVNAMTALFQRRDPTAVEQFYSPNYVQHNPNIPQGRDALKSIVGELSPEVFYEPGMVIAEGNFVAIHGRIRGWAPKPQVVVDLFRVENGQLAEHWDVLQDEIEGGEMPMFSPDERSIQASFHE